MVVVVVKVDDEAEAMAALLLRAAVIGRAPRLGELFVAVKDSS
jgi:hypothetical protein